ncbi:hypothetical protein PVAG01_07862 [Phlyctema vagabunda]|uniref:Uncharacterized protein n=1 Tax=Phlyctema vagabunda TaxID=108571 RepID=A0ABR4PE54_9HELO
MFFSSSPSSPYNSYSATPAMEIPTTASSARPTSSSTTCAYPSWPRRASLSNSSNSSGSTFEHATSYISDDDLFPLVFDDADTDSNASPTTSPAASMHEHIIVGVENVACTDFMKELMAEEKARKQRERETKRRSRSSSSRKSRGSSHKKMSPILESSE